LARALAAEPQVLVADEPCRRSICRRAQILGLLQALRREMALAVLLITHDLAIVGKVATAWASCTSAGCSRSGPSHR
jgi:peptide/nickel transport system ATP-binding protein